MALPESGTTGSNVLKLEDIRNKQKKSTRVSKSPAQSQKVDEKHSLITEIEKDTHPVGKVAQFKRRSKSDLSNEEVNTEVLKTPAKRSLVSNRRFDKLKVDRIKAAIADDSYQIDYLQLADKFIEHERFG